MEFKLTSMEFKLTSNLFQLTSMEFKLTSIMQRLTSSKFHLTARCENPPEEEITVGDNVCDCAEKPNNPNTATKIKNLLFMINCFVITILN